MMRHKSVTSLYSLFCSQFSPFLKIVFPTSQMQTIKLVVVGDRDSGKHELLLTYTGTALKEEHIPIVSWFKYHKLKKKKKTRFFSSGNSWHKNLQTYTRQISTALLCHTGCDTCSNWTLQNTKDRQYKHSIYSTYMQNQLKWVVYCVLTQYSVDQFLLLCVWSLKVSIQVSAAAVKHSLHPLTSRAEVTRNVGISCLLTHVAEAWTWVRRNKARHDTSAYLNNCKLIFMKVLSSFHKSVWLCLVML